MTIEWEEWARAVPVGKVDWEQEAFEKPDVYLKDSGGNIYRRMPDEKVIGPLTSEHVATRDENGNIGINTVKQLRKRYAPPADSVIVPAPEPVPVVEP